MLRLGESQPCRSEVELTGRRNTTSNGHTAVWVRRSSSVDDDTRRKSLSLPTPRSSVSRLKIVGIVLSLFNWTETRSLIMCRAAATVMPLKD